MSNDARRGFVGLGWLRFLTGIAACLFIGAAANVRGQEPPAEGAGPWDSQVDAVLAVDRTYGEAKKLLEAGMWYLGTKRLYEAREQARLLDDPAQRRVAEIDRQIRYFEAVFQLPRAGRIQVEQIGLLNKLAHLHASKENYREAIRVMRDANDAEEQLLGRDSPIFRVRQALIARFYYWMNDYQNGDRLFADVLKETEELVGKDSGDAGAILAVWGQLMMDYDAEFSRSEELLRRGLATLLANEPESTNCARAYENLEIIARETGRLAEAERLNAKAMEHARRWYPTTPRESLLCLADRGRLRVLQGRFEAANEDLRRAAAALEKLAGADDEEYMLTLVWLAQLQTETGKLDEAERQLNEVLELTTEEHEDARAHALRWLAEVHLRRGEASQAFKLLSKSRAIIEDKYGPDYRFAIQLLKISVPVLRSIDQAQQAEEFESRIEARNVRVARKPRAK